MAEDSPDRWQRVDVVIGTVHCLLREDQKGELQSALSYGDIGLVTVELVSALGERYLGALGLNYEIALRQARAIGNQLGIPVVDTSAKGSLQ